jgi:hypothetical protein
MLAVLQLFPVRMGGLDHQRCTVSDPDGNGWLLQVITARLSAALKPNDPRFTPGILRTIFGGEAG